MSLTDITSDSALVYNVEIFFKLCNVLKRLHILQYFFLLFPLVLLKLSLSTEFINLMIIKKIKLKSVVYSYGSERCGKSTQMTDRCITFSVIFCCSVITFLSDTWSADGKLKSLEQNQS